MTAAIHYRWGRGYFYPCISVILQDRGRRSCVSRKPTEGWFRAGRSRTSTAPSPLAAGPGHRSVPRRTALIGLWWRPNGPRSRDALVEYNLDIYLIMNSMVHPVDKLEYRRDVGLSPSTRCKCNDPDQWFNTLQKFN